MRGVTPDKSTTTRDEDKGRDRGSRRGKSAARDDRKTENATRAGQEKGKNAARAKQKTEIVVRDRRERMLRSWQRERKASAKQEKRSRYSQRATAIATGDDGQ